MKPGLGGQAGGGDRRETVMTESEHSPSDIGQGETIFYCRP